MTDRSATEQILSVLQPFASNWTGTLGRGDLVIPQREIPRLIQDILDTVHAAEPCCEATEREVFEAVRDARRLSSLQDLVSRLRTTFQILKR